MEFLELKDTEFIKFYDKAKNANFMQSVERRDLRKRMGYGAELVGVKRDGEVVAAALLVIKNKEVWVQIGPILDYKDKKLLEFFLDNLKVWAKEHGYYEIEVYPPVLLSVRNMEGEKLEKDEQEAVFEVFDKEGFSHMGFSEKVDFKALRWMFIKNLDGLKDMREVELSFNASTRKKFHQTQRNLEMHVVKDKSELKDWIKPLRESDERNGIKTRGLKYFEDMFDVFGDKAVFVEARLKETGEIVSSEVDIFDKNESVAFLAGTTEALKKYNGITAVKGWQLDECLKRGQTRANFYGVDGIFSLDNPLLRTKAGFGGVVEEYIGGFQTVLNKPKYFVSKQAARIKGKLGRK